MGTIVVRDLPDDVHDIFQRLAAEKHQTFDAFVRDTLVQIVTRMTQAQQPAEKPRKTSKE